MADADSVEQALRLTRKLMVDLGVHLDRAAETRDLAEVGRAWVRAAQVERVLRAALPPAVAESAEAEVVAAAEAAAATVEAVAATVEAAPADGSSPAADAQSDARSGGGPASGADAPPA